MQIPIYQIVILTILATLSYIESMSLHLVLGQSAITTGIIAGIVCGDVKLGLYVGAMLQSFALGLGPFGGTSIPDWNLVALIVTPICIAQGGIDAVPQVITYIGVPLGVLTTQLDVLARTLNGITQHMVDKDLEEGKSDATIMRHWWTVGSLCFGLSRGVPCLICLIVGPSLIETLGQVIPAWVNMGLSIATGIMPAVGLAILLRFLPTKRYIHYLILGFVLASYFAAPSLAIALVGFILAAIEFSRKEGESKAVMTEGGVYDE